MRRILLRFITAMTVLSLTVIGGNSGIFAERAFGESAGRVKTQEEI